MKTKKSMPVEYTNEKTKVRITGDPEDVNGYIWTDIISSNITRFVVAGCICILVIRETDLLPLILAWLKKRGFI